MDKVERAQQVEDRKEEGLEQDPYYSEDDINSSMYSQPQESYEELDEE